MINTEMRTYNFSTIGNKNDYGQELSSFEIKGKIKMCIALTSQAVVDNINYKDASYIGLTQDSLINDSYIINYGDKRLKVLYITPARRYKTVFLSEI